MTESGLAITYDDFWSHYEQTRVLQKTIVMDPPWTERGGGKIKRGADRHYPVMSVKQILAELMEEDTAPFMPDPEGCSLWLWTTVNKLPDALWLMKELEFTYVTSAVWVKAKDLGEVTIRHNELDESFARVVEPDRPGLGQRMRICHELLLFGRLGNVPRPPTDKRLPSTIYAPRGKHSAKPEEAFRIVEAHDQHTEHMDPFSRVELFARSARPGWTCWGHGVNT